MNIKMLPLKLKGLLHNKWCLDITFVLYHRHLIAIAKYIWSRLIPASCLDWRWFNSFESIWCRFLLSPIDYWVNSIHFIVIVSNANSIIVFK